MPDNPFLNGARRIRSTIQRALGMPEDKALNEFDRWVLDGNWQTVSSSHVAAIGYDALNQMVKIEYLGGKRWGYWPLPIAMAKGLYYTGSKGTWLYDYVRVRGKGNSKQHQVNAGIIA